MARVVWRIEVPVSTKKKVDARFFASETREEAAEAWGVELAAVSSEPLGREERQAIGGEPQSEKKPKQREGGAAGPPPFLEPAPVLVVEDVAE
jgi:hypothetical protein